MKEISNLYNEIILKGDFQKIYNKLDFFEKNGKYCTVFSNNKLVSKILIIDTLTNVIVYQNLKVENNDLVILNTDIKNDKSLFSFNKSTGLLVEFLNPINQNSNTIRLIRRIDLSFSLQNISINDILVFENSIFIIIKGKLIEQPNKGKSLEQIIGTKGAKVLLNNHEKNNKLIEAIFSQIKTENRIIFFEFNKEASNVIEYDNSNFDDDFEYYGLNYTPNKNIISFEFFNAGVMEPIMGLLNFKSKKMKFLSPSELITVSSNYALVLPNLGYNSFTEFLLVRLEDFVSADLSPYTEYLLTEEESYLIYSDWRIEEKKKLVDFYDDNTLKIKGTLLECSELFKKNKQSESISTFISDNKFITINNDSLKGYALDIHTIKSSINDDGTFDTIRTDIGDMLFNLKYKFDKSSIIKISEKCANLIKEIGVFDFIIPVPPSNLNRPFQPVYELAKTISDLTGIYSDLYYVTKISNEEIKTLDNSEDRLEILEKSIFVKDNRYKGKNILLFDDLYRSGDTLKVISEKLIKVGEVNSVVVLCVTKTRTKR